MTSSAAPKCPRCLDGGKMTLEEAAADPDSSIFHPLPPGAADKAQIYRCSECGWTIKPSPPCPACGGTEAAVLSEVPQYAATDPHHKHIPVETRSVYKCSCGTVFTHTVKIESQIVGRPGMARA